jgi:hypothetical protein
MKNVLFNIKSVITGSSKAVVGSGAGAGAETLWSGKNSFGSTTFGKSVEAHAIWESESCVRW